MPYVSDAQRRYFNANRGKLEKQGVDVDEWNQASKGKDLPERTAPPKPKRRGFASRIAPPAGHGGPAGK